VILFSFIFLEKETSTKKKELKDQKTQHL